jgi:hypothetical protein
VKADEGNPESFLSPCHDFGHSGRHDQQGMKE